MHVSIAVLLSTWVCAHGAPWRSAEEHGPAPRAPSSAPYLYAAIPLHGPVPVLHVLSRRPLIRDRLHEPSVQHPVYARPPRPDFDYAASTNDEYDYAGTGYGDPHDYRDPYQHSPYAQQDAAPSQDELTVLYARPNPHGGYSYRRGPARTAPSRSPPPATDSPVIIRVHRYRLVRDP